MSTEQITIKRLFDEREQKTGEGKNGSWTLRSAGAIATLASGEDVSCTIKSFSDTAWAQVAEGAVFTAERREREYNGKTYVDFTLKSQPRSTALMPTGGDVIDEVIASLERALVALRGLQRERKTTPQKRDASEDIAKEQAAADARAAHTFEEESGKADDAIPF